jgi:hypothetical protein
MFCRSGTQYFADYLYFADYNNTSTKRKLFQACPVWIYTQSNITSILFIWVDYTNTANIMIIRLHWYRRNHTQFRNIRYSYRPDRVAQFAEHWASIPKYITPTQQIFCVLSSVFDNFSRNIHTPPGPSRTIITRWGTCALGEYCIGFGIIFIF